MAWRFKDYVNQRGDNEIRQWLDSLPKPVRIKIDARIRILQTVEQLKYPYVEKWVGEDDLYEVRVVFGGTQYRSLGCYGPERRDFTLLIGAVEKGGQLEPRNAVKTAKTRMMIIGDRNHVCDHFQY